MKENYYKKFINFLKEHNLYDENAMEYYIKKVSSLTMLKKKIETSLVAILQ